MTRTRSRKICLAVLGLAALALGVDRLFLAGTSGPQPASASSLPAADGSGSTAAPQDTKAVPTDKRPPTLASLLEKAAEPFGLAPAEMRDAFTIAEVWLAELQGPPPEPPPEPAEPTEPQPTAGEAFAGRHKLTSVILSSRGGSAVVDGKIVPVGQALDGFTLLRVTRDSAIFGTGGEEVELHLRRENR